MKKLFLFALVLVSAFSLEAHRLYRGGGWYGDPRVFVGGPGYYPYYDGPGIGLSFTF